MKIVMQTALVCALWAQQAVAAEKTPAKWYSEPFRLTAGGQLLDTYPDCLGGHAAPWLADIDGDGLRELVVGSIGGRFHLFKNIGTDAAPAFGPKSTWLMAGLSANEPARVPNFCCVAAGPQLVDVDGDGVLDMTSGSYQPAYVYWFKGRGDGTFHARHILTDMSGRPILPLTDRNPYLTANGNTNLMTNLAWADWDNNGSPDLILGNFRGQLFVRLNVRGVMEDGSSMPSATQPQFMANSFQKIDEIRIDGANAIPERHAAPAVADWDGDGVWDILVGAESGRVYWLRNSGKPGAPVFSTCEEIVGPGEGNGGQWVQSGKDPARGIRAQIQVVDFNRDGKLDLLVGDWGVIRTIRADLTRAGRRDLDGIFKELAVLDRKVAFDSTTFESRYHFRGYNEDVKTLASAHALETQMTKYLVRVDPKERPDYQQLMAYEKHMGHVWVYLRK